MPRTLATVPVLSSNANDGGRDVRGAGREQPTSTSETMSSADASGASLIWASRMPMAAGSA